MPKVSVIIPVYNCENFIEETVRSVLAQTYQDFEIIVVDDGSKDRTGEIIRNIKDSRVVYIRQENAGVSKARNNGIQSSKGEYIALLDHDDLWLPEKLEKQIPLLENNPELGMVYSDCYIINLKGNIIGKSFRDHPPHRGKIIPDLFLDGFIPCLTAIIRRNILDKVGLFEPQFSIAEEYDLFRRIAEISEVDFVDLPLAIYRVHETSFSRNTVRVYEEERDATLRFLEYHPELRGTLGNKVNKRLAAIYYNLGKAYFFRGDIEKSRYWFNEARKTCRFFLYPACFKLLTLGGVGFVKFLRNCRRKLMGLAGREE